jgi:hypothetical protein
MMHSVGRHGRYWRTALAAASLGLLLQAWPAGARDREAFDDPYSIMTPEPWLAPKHNSPRGIPKRPKAAKPRHTPAPPVEVARPAPPVVLPNGQVVPSLPPAPRGFVPGGGAETFGDRAIRCSHQAGVYGITPGQQPTYMGACVQ